MRKFILFLAFLSLGLLVTLSVLAPNSSPMWIAATTTPFVVLRTFIMAILFTLMTTSPPRNVYFRGFVSVVTVVLAGWVLGNDGLKILDSISLIGTCCAMGVTVLEVTPETTPRLVSSKQKVATA